MDRSTITIAIFQRQQSTTPILDDVTIQHMIDARNKQNLLTQADIEYFRSKKGTHMLWYGVRHNSDDHRPRIYKTFSDEIDQLVGYEHVTYISDIPILQRVE